MKFWPKDIAPQDLRIPFEIMNEAAAELMAATSLGVAVRTEVLADRVVHYFECANPARDMAIQVFTASHQLDLPYPAVLDPPKIRTPEFLKPVRYVGGGRTAVVSSGSVKVENPWICSDAAEFESKLKLICASESVKTLLHRLQYKSPVHASNNAAIPDGIETTAEPPTDAPCE